MSKKNNNRKFLFFECGTSRLRNYRRRENDSGSGNNNDDNGTRISTRSPTRTRMWMQMWMAKVNANANVNVNGNSRREGKPNTLGQFSFVFTVYDAANSSETLADTLSLPHSLLVCVVRRVRACVYERVCGVRREGSSWLRLRLRCDTSTYSTPTDATASAVVGSVSSAAALASLGIPLAMRVGSPTRWHVHLHSCWPAERSLQQVGCLSESYSNNVAGAEAR